MMRLRVTALAALAAICMTGGVAVGQGRGGREGAAAAPRAVAPFDMTGFWVSMVTEDWRWRMMTPPKGDYTSVPLNAEGRRVADGWDLARDRAEGNECRAFGVGGVMRLAGRLHVTWQDDAALKIETSAGNQTRLLRFAVPGAPLSAPGERGWQGVSVAEWKKQPQVTGILGAPRPGSVAGGNLKVVTTRMRPGYLRLNGVPYSENAVITEYYNRHTGPRDLEWLTVTTIVEDPMYLQQSFITSTDFKKEPDGSKFTPTPCAVDPPRVPTGSGGR